MPGTPVLYYGDEIGMGDNVFLGDRDGVRTPMQWSFDRNGGFSRADPARLYLPPIMDPVYGFEAVNVEAQSRSPSSLLNWTKRLIAARRSRRAFGRGTLALPLSVEPQGHRLSARLWTARSILCVANLSRSAQAVELDLSRFRGRQPIELLGRSVFPRIGELPYLLTLQGHSFFWFELAAARGRELAERCERRRRNSSRWSCRTAGPICSAATTCRSSKREVIPGFLPRQRWFGAKDRRVQAVACWRAARSRAPPKRGQRGRSVSGCRSSRRSSRGGERQRYFLPLAADLGGRDSDLRQALMPVDPGRIAPVPPRGRAGRCAVAGRLFAGAARRDPREAALPLTDGAGQRGEIRFRQDAALRADRRCRSGWSCAASAPSSRTARSCSRITAVLKLYRRLQPGPHPEIEMSRFLVERAGFANTPPLLATIELALPGTDGRRRRARRAVRLCAQPGRRLDPGARLPDRAISTTR